MVKKMLIGIGVVAVGTAACVGYISYKKYVARKAFVGAISEAIKGKEAMNIDDLDNIDQVPDFEEDFEAEKECEDFFAEKKEEAAP